MAFFYDRIETENTITIRLKNMIIFYIAFYFFVMLLMGVVLLSFFIPTISCILFPFVIGPCIALWLTLRKVNLEVKEAMKKGKVKVSGSRFSSSNPLTYEIEKSSPPAV